MSSSLAFDANLRVENYRKSVAFVDENVLMFKGFLGPSLKEKPEVASVGARAARAAGVIVDSLGKLRCPPGTPNANQFTDLQMSNCMVPGMGTAKKMKDRLANSVGTLLKFADKAMDKKGVKGAARVATMAALVGLDVLDYNHNDGSGAMSATILAMNDIVRSAGREIAERALDRLQRNGKITQEQREQLDKVVDKLAPIAAERLVLGGIQSVNAWRRGRQLRRKTPQLETNPHAAFDVPSAKRGDVVMASTVEEGLQAILEGRIVEMPDVAGAHTLVEELGKMALDAEARGEKLTYDLCKVTVANTNVFCAGNLGIERDLMPQAKGDAVPGSRAEQVLKEQNAARVAAGKPETKEVDGTEDFLKRINEKGIAVSEPTRVPASKLKATQRNMKGETVGGMMKNESYDPSKEPIFVSRDGYVVDGHHRWAATLGRDMRDGVLGDDTMNVIIIDAPISEILQIANEWTDDFGIKRKGVPGTSPKPQTVETPKPAQPTLKTPRHLAEPNAMNSVDLSQVLPSAPEKSMRTENNMPITVDAERFNAELAQKVSSLLEKHGIDKSLPPSQQLDALARKMGVSLRRPMPEQLDDSIEYLLGEGKTVAEGFVQGINNPDPLAVQVLRVKGQSILDAIKLAESGPEGRAQVREAIAQGYLEAITGVEMMFTDNPAMRGALILDLHGGEYAKKFPAMKEAAGYAYQTYTPNGMMTQVNFLPHSLMFDQDAIQGIVPKGQGLNHSVRFSGADDHQIGLGIHEAAHAEHFYHQYAALGIKIGQNSGTIEQQVRAKGPRLEDSYIGVMFAHRYEFSPEMTWDKVVEQLDKAGSNESLDSLMAVVAQDATRTNMKTGTPADDVRTGYLHTLFGGKEGKESGKRSVDVIEAVENYQRAQMFPNIVPHLPKDEQGNQIPLQRLTQAQQDEVYRKAKEAVKLELPEGIELVDPNTGEVLSDEDAAKVVKDAMGGQYISGLSQEYNGVRNDYLGIKESTISTNGVPNEEVMAALGNSSDYGKTNIMEATAEGRVVDVYGRNFTSFNMPDEQVTKVREMLGRLFPENYEGRPSGKPQSAAVLQEKIQKIISQMPTIRRKEGSVDSVV
jgi:hypothetical protein